MLNHYKTFSILTFDSFAILASKPLAKCQSKIEQKILSSVLSSKESIERINICLANLRETSSEPPPGGPMAATNNWKIIRMAAD